ncbi:MAG: Gfo/Idh/MocA family protein [Halobacteriales archaeon]
MTYDQITAGVIGLGTQGRRHAEQIADLGAQIVGGADVAADARESFTDTFDAPAYEDHETLYDDAAPDAVVITTPNCFHEAAAVAAFERDVSVLIEKPLAHTLESAERIVAAAADSAGVGMVGFKNRYCAAAEVFDAHHEAGRFGDLVRVEANFLRRRGAAVGTWFADKEMAGGGALIDIGVHALDFALYLLGFPEIVEVCGSTRSDLAGREDYVDPNGWGDPERAEEAGFDVDDSAVAFLRTAEGAVVTLDVAWAANRQPSREIVVRGTEAGAAMDLGGGDLAINEVSGAGSDHFVDVDIEGSMERSALAGEDADFLEAVAAGEPPAMNTLEEGLTVQRLLDAIYRSSEAGGSVAP